MVKPNEAPQPQEVSGAIERTEGEERQKSPEMEIMPNPEAEMVTLSQKADALVKRFELLLTKLEGAASIEEGNVLLEKARVKHAELLDRLNGLKDQIASRDIATRKEKDLEKLKKEWFRSGGESRGEIEKRINILEDELGNAPKGEITFGDEEKVIGDLERESRKVGGEFAPGLLVSWPSDDGGEMVGEIVGLAEAVGSVIVKTAKNPGGFAISKEKLERRSEPAGKLAEKISQTQSLEDLIKLFDSNILLRGDDGRVYDADTLHDALLDVKEERVDPDSPFINLLPKTEGLRAKVLEFVKKEKSKRVLEEKRDHFADKDAELNRKYGTVIGWLRRQVGSRGYLEALMARTEAYEEYEKERAETVFASIEKMTGEQIALADSRAAAFKEAQGWGAKAYNFYKSNPVFKKFKYARLAVGVGLMGAGLAGAPVAATLGSGFIAWQLLGRGLGGVGATIGSYDLMSMLARGRGTKILSKNAEAQLKEFTEEKGLSKIGRFFNKKVKVDGQDIGARDLYERKKFELESEQAEHMNDERLDELIGYYEAVVASDGKKPSEDPKYMMLMKEKSKRYQKALTGEQLGIKEKVVQKRFSELKEAQILKLTDYLNQKSQVGRILFEKMQAAGGKGTPEYEAWQAGRQKLQKIFDSLPPELQTFVDKYSSDWELSKLELLVDDSSSAGETIDAEIMEISPERLKEVHELLDQNEPLRQTAKEEGEREMGVFIADVENQENKTEQKFNAIMALAEEGLRQAQDRLDTKRTEKGYSAVGWKRVRMAMAVLIGVGMGTGIIQKKIMEMFGVGTAEAAPRHHVGSTMKAESAAAPAKTEILASHKAAVAEAPVKSAVIEKTPKVRLPHSGAKIHVTHHPAGPSEAKLPQETVKTEAPESVRISPEVSAGRAMPILDSSLGKLGIIDRSVVADIDKMKLDALNKGGVGINARDSAIEMLRAKVQDAGVDLRREMFKVGQSLAEENQTAAVKHLEKLNSLADKHNERFGQQIVGSHGPVFFKNGRPSLDDIAKMVKGRPSVENMSGQVATASESIIEKPAPAVEKQTVEKPAEAPSKYHPTTERRMDKNPAWKKVLGSKERGYHVKFQPPHTSPAEESMHAEARSLPKLYDELKKAEAAGDEKAAWKIRQDIGRITDFMKGGGRSRFRP